MNRIKVAVERHPFIAMWIILAIGMVAILFLLGPTESTLLPREWAVIVIATILLAGLCVWIISWESGAEEEETKG